MKRPPIDPDLLRDRLAPAQGKQYWSSLEQMAGDPAVTEMLQREFPDGASEWTDPVSRRQFLTLMGASLALAGLASSGCGVRPPTGTIRPFVRQPENQVLGKPLYYATSMSLSGYAVGLLVESHEGRPTKIEGNPNHPASLGAAGPMQQAATLGLYDPDRAQTVTYRGQPRSWGDLVAELRSRLRKGKLAILTEAVGSPTLRRQIDDFLAQAKRDGVEATWFVYEPVNRDNVHAGSSLAFGSRSRSYHDFEKADVVVSLDADFCGRGPSQLADVRGFMKRRGREYRRDQNPELKEEKREQALVRMAAGNRLYVIETNLSITGAKADERLAVRPGDVERMLRALAAEVELLVGTLAARRTVQGNPLDVPAPGDLSDEQKIFVKAIAKDLLNVDVQKDKNLRGVEVRGEDRSGRKGHSLILAGDGQPPSVHALVHALNHRLGNVGQTVHYTAPLLADNDPPSAKSLDELVTALGQFDTLLILGGNPAYTAPSDVALARKLEERLKSDDKARWLAVHCSPYFDETARLCHWHVPQSHFLEAWSDAVAFDGTASVVQPLIAPLYATKSLHEVIAALSKRKADKPEDEQYDERTGLELVRDYWKEHQPEATKKAGFETFWQVALHDGVIPAKLDSDVVSASLKREVVPFRMAAKETPKLAADLVKKLNPVPASADPYDVVFAPDPGVYDGRFANLGWLQEWPRPLTRLTWDNAALVSPKTAQKLVGAGENRIGQWRGGGHGEVIADKVSITVGKNKLDVPLFVVPGHADDAVTLYLGYGREHGGKVGSKVGFNANKIRPSDRSWVGAAITKVSGSHVLACVQSHHNVEGRDIVRSGTFDKYKTEPGFIQEHDHHGPPAKDEGKGSGNGKRKALPTLYKLPEYDGYKWGMAVDLTACVGCGSCVVACQSENNTPVVGKEQVIRGREMHWIRVSTYWEQTEEQARNLQTPRSWHFQPVACHHCETAPCEVVCPVEATAHSDEGLNDMVYNRCVGTRYCSHNCPYKVRRFNFLNFTENQYTTPSLKLLQNPDVTVRTRGVMEKCTFCIQRISYARIESAKEAMRELDLPPGAERKRRDTNGPDGTPRKQDGKEIPYIHDGEVVTACQAACPADAIVFGDLNDKKSRVHELHASNLRYDLLGDHGTRPRLAYLADLRNPNPELAEPVKKAEDK